MHLINDKYELLDLAEAKGMPSVYDIIDKIKPSIDIPLAATDGKTIFINPHRFNDMKSTMDRFFVLCHEMLHILYKHTQMSKDRFPNRELLNVCQDVVINEYLQKKLRFRQADGIYMDNLSDYLLKAGIISGPITYHGILTTTELYNYLDRFMDRDEMQDIIDQLSGDLLDDQDQDETLNDQVLREVCKTLKITKDIMKREMRLSDTQVETEENMELVSDSEASKTLTKGGGTPAEPVKVYSTREIIDFIKDFVGNNAVIRKRAQTFSRPNRRISSPDYVMKGHKYAKNIKEITIYLDTSGSMNSQFIADMQQTLQALYQTTKFRLFQFDNWINEVNLKTDRLYTGGGTNITNVLNHIKKNKFDVSIMITDCEDKFSLKGVDSDLMIFTNDMKFKSDNKKVKVSYFKV